MPPDLWTGLTEYATVPLRRPLCQLPQQKTPDLQARIFGSESGLQLIWQKYVSLRRREFFIPFKKKQPGRIVGITSS
jgi:hypothetical protein